MGTVSLSIFTSSNRPPIYISTHNEWNHSASYVGIPTSLEDIQLLLDQRSKAEFQWTSYEDLAIRAVIPDELFQNPNVWHVKVPLVNYATVEMHQSDRVLRQFEFRQPISVAPEVFDEEHKVNLQQLHTDWPRFWSHYIEMWENRYDYIPTQEPIIVPELAERRGSLNPRRRDDDAGPSTAPTQSSSPTVQRTTLTSQPFQIMPGAYPSLYMYPNPYMFPFPSPMAGWNPWPRSSSFPITLSQPPIYRPPSHEDRLRHHRGALLSTNLHHLTRFKHLMGDANIAAIIILSRWFTLPTATTRSPAGGTTTLARSCSKEESSTDPSTTPMWH
ncbi:hypothetical protein CXB51_034648 [Gossypium anomalum]|uniref:Aminotransferase-like plant mobile domain-containing protein n=1 Tax=Gossypium anomalum TaxID=47600 RepID=A0A8J6CHI4_9ROSI|nr:hypothetical protein CXB51_034648 [Gossypium anomalum]